MSDPSRLAFLDRDGVINRDTGYIGSPSDFELLPGVSQALRMLSSSGYRLIVVTNQSGIGRGYFTDAQYREVTTAMHDALMLEGVRLDAVVHCPHHPDAGCCCRKPAPGMLLQALQYFAADPARSLIFGDKRSDLIAGARAGVSMRFLIGPPELSTDTLVTGQGPTLLACVEQLLISD